MHRPVDAPSLAEISNARVRSTMIGNNVGDAVSDTILLMKIYLVGGAVRDQLLGRPIRERDWVVVGATPQAMEQLGFRAKDPHFPVYLHPETRGVRSGAP